MDEGVPTINRPYRVAYITSNEGFCAYYRLAYPADALARAGLIEYKTCKPMCETMPDIVDWADICVFQFGQPQQFIMRLAEEIKLNKIPKLIVLEYDDDYFNIDVGNHKAAIDDT